jgi:hypothetical protein
VPAVTGTGDAKVTCCHPLADSLKVADASLVPAADQSVPVWVPVFDASLKKRIPVM